MNRTKENTSFICAHCGKAVCALTNGSYRNHCPFCLYSMHVDEVPGDRRSECAGLMRPMGAIFHGKKGWQIVHECLKCGARRHNKIAENTEMPDDFDVLIGLMRGDLG